jgi:hypothetical protein
MDAQRRLKDKTMQSGYDGGRVPDAWTVLEGPRFKVSTSDFASWITTLSLEAPKWIGSAFDSALNSPTKCISMLEVPHPLNLF